MAALTSALCVAFFTGQLDVVEALESLELVYTRSGKYNRNTTLQPQLITNAPNVTDSGHRGRVGLIAAVSVFIIVVAVAVGFVIYKKRGTRLNSNPGPADEEAVEEPIQHV